MMRKSDREMYRSLHPKLQALIAKQPERKQKHLLLILRLVNRAREDLREHQWEHWEKVPQLKQAVMELHDAWLIISKKETETPMYVRTKNTSTANR